jgi:hypothetical protein
MENEPQQRPGQNDNDGVPQMPSDTGEKLPREALEQGPVIVELPDGYVALFDQAADGVAPFDLSLLPDRERLAEVLGTAGNVGTLGGNIAGMFQGVYRVDAATQALLSSGAQLAVKDGANLGAIFMNGKLVAQARFIPVAATAAGLVAAVGPALAMLALQTMISDVRGLIQTNNKLTSQILKEIRQKEWAKLEAMVEQVDDALDYVHKCEGVPDTLWSQIDSLDTLIREQEKLYRVKVSDHQQQLSDRGDPARREYLRMNASAIAFDSHALLRIVRARAIYDTLCAARAREKGETDPRELKLAESTSRKALRRLEESARDVRSLMGDLTREVGKVAESEDGSSLLVKVSSLTKKSRDVRESRKRASQLLKVLEPLAKGVHAVPSEVAAPEMVCVPEGEDIKRYLSMLRWHLGVDEELRGVAIVEEAPADDRVQGSLSSQKDGAQKPLGWVRDTFSRAKDIKDGIVDRSASGGLLVAVTDQQILTAEPKEFLKPGAEMESIEISEKTRVRRTRHGDAGQERERIRLTLENGEVMVWQFPEKAEQKTVNQFAVLMRPEATPRPVTAGEAVQEAGPFSDETGERQTRVSPALSS